MTRAVLFQRTGERLGLVEPAHSHHRLDHVGQVPGIHLLGAGHLVRQESRVQRVECLAVVAQRLLEETQRHARPVGDVR